jgi:putative glycosyltransferase (TIGR04372 family)
LKLFNNFRFFINKKIKSLFLLYDLYKSHPSYGKKVIFNRVFKIIYPLYITLLSPLLIFPLIAIRLLRPFFLIRIGKLESEGIGHFTLPVEIYLAEKDYGIHKTKKTIDIWYLGKIVCNNVLKNKWKEHLIIFPRFIFGPLDSFNMIIPGGLKNTIPYRRIEDTNYAALEVEKPWQAVDIFDVIQRTRPKITFSTHEKNSCKEKLQTIGFDISKKFVCFNIRDSSYHNDIDLFSHRNSSINDYHLVFNYLNELGYQVIRLGSKVNEKLTLEGPLIFDYASSDLRSDLIDLYLISECSFSVGTGCGLDCASVLFRKMHAFINIVQLGTIPDFAYGSIIIFKRFVKDGKELTLEDMKNNGYMSYTISSQYENEGISFKNNTDKEIKEVLWETHARVSGKWKDDVLHKKNQEKFKSLFSIKAKGSGISALIGSDFIKTIN